MSEIEPPNYTQIPNVIFDYWMPRLKPATFTVLLCLCRKIFGWHKNSDTISRNQLINATGMSKNTVKTALDDLIEIGLVIKIQSTTEYGHQPNVFTLHITKPDEPQYDQNLGRGGSNNDQGVGQNLTKGVGQKLTTQKKDNTKERLTKENTVGGQILELGENGNCRLTDSEKAKLLEKMNAQELEYWIAEIDIAVGTAGGLQAFRRKYKTKTETHYFTILSWKRKREAEGKPIGKQTGGPEANREYAIYVQDNYKCMAPQRNVRIEVGNRYIEFVPQGGQMPSTVINFTDKGFKEQVDNAIRKWRLAG